MKKTLLSLILASTFRITQSIQGDTPLDALSATMNEGKMWSMSRLRELESSDQKFYLHAAVRNIHDNVFVVIHNTNDDVHYGNCVLINPEERIFMSAGHVLPPGNSIDLYSYANKTVSARIEERVTDLANDVVIFRLDTNLDFEKYNAITIDPKASKWSGPIVIDTYQIAGTKNNNYVAVHEVRVGDTIADIEIETGMSGSPLCTEYGKLVGIVTGVGKNTREVLRGKAVVSISPKHEKRYVASRDDITKLYNQFLLRFGTK